MGMSQGTIIVMGVSALGFIVGFAIGSETRDNTPSNVETSYDDGVVIIRADLGNALRQGFRDFVDNFS
jgi:hypothetical protein